MFEAVVFDFDGVILETELADFLSWRTVYSEFGIELPLSRWTAAIGADATLFDPYAYLGEATEQPLDWAAIRRRRRRERDRLLRTERTRPGVLHLLAEARARGMKTAIASSSSRDWVLPHVSRLGLRRLFDLVRCCEDCAAAKPDPSVYVSLLADLGVTGDRAIAIEDSPNGVAAARAAGLFVLAVPTRMTRMLDFGAASAVVGSLDGVRLTDFLREDGGKRSERAA